LQLEFATVDFAIAGKQPLLLLPDASQLRLEQLACQQLAKHVSS
jgi:hypothetical protein